MSIYNFPSAASALHLAAAASQASTLTGDAVDLNDYEGTLAITQSHGTSTGTLDGKIQDSANGTTGWADVTGAVFTQETTTVGVQTIAVPVKSCKRYIRYVGTVGTGPQVFSVVALGFKKTV